MSLPSAGGEGEASSSAGRPASEATAAGQATAPTPFAPSDRRSTISSIQFLLNPASPPQSIGREAAAHHATPIEPQPRYPFSSTSVSHQNMNQALASAVTDDGRNSRPPHDAASGLTILSDALDSSASSSAQVSSLPRSYSAAPSTSGVPLHQIPDSFPVIATSSAQTPTMSSDVRQSTIIPRQNPNHIITAPTMFGREERKQIAKEKAERWDKVKRCLACPLCPPGTLLHKPVTLSCGHTMCRTHAHSLSNVPDEPTSPPGSPKQLLRCPLPTCLGKLHGWENSKMDVSIDRIVGLVKRVDGFAGSGDSGEMDAEGSEDDDDGEAQLPSSSAGEYEGSAIRIPPPASGIQPAPAEFSPSPMGSPALPRTQHHHLQQDDVVMRSRLAGRATSSRNAGKMNADFALKELSNLLDCDVCASLLFESITTECGHTFCKRCLSRSLDHSSLCPICRSSVAQLPLIRERAFNKLLNTITITAFPLEIIERKEFIEREDHDLRMDTPIFVCTLAFPCMPTVLHVFEAKYRLMLRRCIESNSPRFGMVLPVRPSPTSSSTNPPVEYGTMLEIRSVQTLEDGRSMVETVGSWRFKLLEKGIRDGYTVGRIERFDDISAEEEATLERTAVARAAAATRRASRAGSVGGYHPAQQQNRPLPNIIRQPTQETSADYHLLSGIHAQISQAQLSPSVTLPPIIPQQDLQSVDAHLDPVNMSTEQLMNICEGFINQLRSGSAPWLLQRLNHTYGPMPTEPSICSYWMASVMPIDDYEKAHVLAIRSPRLRLALLVHWIERLRASWWFSSGCVCS